MNALKWTKPVAMVLFLGALASCTPPTGPAGELPEDPGTPVASNSLPKTTITQRPSGALSLSASASFAFACDLTGCTFECAWDGEGFAACASPASRSGFADGAHTFAVKASKAGAVETTPVSETFSVDGVAPTASFSAPASLIPNSQASTFTLACSEANCTFECSLDGAAFSACPQLATFNDLVLGSHTLNIRATDATGNVSTTAAHTWSVSFGWKSLDANETNACAVGGDGRLYCWGKKDQGGLLAQGGTGPTGPFNAPRAVGSANDWESVTLGRYLACAKKKSGMQHCWGDNDSSQFGDPLLATNVIYREPTAVGHATDKLTLGHSHTCGIDAGSLYCWGYGGDGHLGDGDDASHITPARTKVGTATWLTISTNYGHSCGIQSDATLWCFGDNWGGQSGRDPLTVYSVNVPSQVGASSDWSKVSAGVGFTCAIKRPPGNCTVLVTTT